MENLCSQQKIHRESHGGTLLKKDRIRVRDKEKQVEVVFLETYIIPKEKARRKAFIKFFLST